MNSWLFLFFFFFFIFVLILYIYLKSKNIKLTREDYYHWLKINNRLRFYKIRLFKNIFNPLKVSLDFFISNTSEKILRRIKIEALKLETWATNRIEKIRKKKEISEAEKNKE